MKRDFVRHRRFLWRSVPTVLSLAGLVMLAACGGSTPTETAKAEPKEEAKAPESSVTGKTAFWEMYKMGHQWAADLVPVQLKSGELEGAPPAKDGEANLWTAIFVSPSTSKAREFTYRAISQGTAHRGVSPGPERTWTSGQKAQTFPTGEIMADSDAAFAKASQQGAAWIKAHPGKPVSYNLFQDSRFKGPVWGVMWGTEKDGYTAVVDAATGEITKPK